MDAVCRSRCDWGQLKSSRMEIATCELATQH
jgi:hypothetical protein